MPTPNKVTFNCRNNTCINISEQITGQTWGRYVEDLQYEDKHNDEAWPAETMSYNLNLILFVY